MRCVSRPSRSLISPKDVHCIVVGLFLACALSAACWYFHEVIDQRFCFRRLVLCTPPFLFSPFFPFQTGRFNFLRLNFYDDRTEDVAWFLYSAFDFIKAAQAQKGRVLVHCVQGVSRCVFTTERAIIG